MPIKISCPQCRKALTVPDQLAGRTGKCPACAAQVSIPMPAAPTLPSAVLDRTNTGYGVVPEAVTVVARTPILKPIRQLPKSKPPASFSLRLKSLFAAGLLATAIAIAIVWNLLVTDRDSQVVANVQPIQDAQPKDVAMDTHPRRAPSSPPKQTLVATTPISKPTASATVPSKKKAITARRNGAEVVTTSKIPVVPGLFCTISFAIIDPNDPDAQKLGGAACIIFFENLITTKDYELSGLDEFNITRGEQALTLFLGEGRQLSANVRSLQFANMTPKQLLDFLSQSGKITVHYEGQEHVLDPKWSEQIDDLVAEVTARMRRNGF